MTPKPGASWRDL